MTHTFQNWTKCHKVSIYSHCVLLWIVTVLKMSDWSHWLSVFMCDILLECICVLWSFAQGQLGCQSTKCQKSRSWLPIILKSFGVNPHKNPPSHMLYSPHGGQRSESDGSEQHIWTWCGHIQLSLDLLMTTPITSQISGFECWMWKPLFIQRKLTESKLSFAGVPCWQWYTNKKCDKKWSRDKIKQWSLQMRNKQ